VKRVAAAVAGLVGLVIVFVVAGCGAGQNTQTDSMPPAVNGAFGQVGPSAIRNVRFAPPSRGVYPAGSSVELLMTIVNTGTVTDDELIEVSSPPVAEDVEISGDRNIPATMALQVGQTGAPAGPSSSSVAVTSTTRPTSSSVTGSSTARPTSSSAAPPVQLGQAKIVLNGLKTPLHSGKTYPVTFVFRNAGSVTIDLPIENPPSARPEPTGESH